MSSILGEKGFLRERTIKSRLETPAASKTPKNQNVLKRKFVLLCSKMRVDGYPVLNVKQMPKGRIMLLGKQNVEWNVEHQILVEYLIFCSVLIKLGNSDKLTFPKQILNIRGLGKSSGWR